MTLEGMVIRIFGYKTKFRLFSAFLGMTFLLSSEKLTSAEMPAGAKIQSGNVSITNKNPDYIVIDQSTHKSIINWNSFSPEEKEAIWKRLEKLKTQIMSSRVKIFDSKLMNEGIKKYRLRVKDDLNDSSKAFEIIKQVSESFEDLMDFGIELFNTEKSLKDLKDDIEIELYTLSKAHYSKYFLEPLKIKKII